MKRIIAVAVALAVVAGGVWIYRGRASQAPVDEGPRTARVARGSLIHSVSATGTLKPYSHVEVRSRATGTVVQVHVQEGDRVSKGQLLVVIDDRDARAEHETRAAQLASAQARLEQSRSQLALTRAQSGTRVAEAEASLATAAARLAQVVAGARPEQIEQSREALRQAELSAELAQANLVRTRDLFAGGFVSRAQIDQAQNQHDAAQAQLRAAQARLREITAGSRIEEIEVSRAQVRQAEAVLAQAKAALLAEGVQAADVMAAEAQVRNVRAQLAQARDRLGESRIQAPIAGIVARQLVQAGQSVIGGTGSGGTLMMTIADVRVVQAAVGVDESDIAQITPGLAVRVTADALLRRTFNGKVTRVAPQAAVVQNVTQYEVIVEVEDPGSDLRLGMTLDAEFIITERQGVLLVPAEAVRGQDAKILIVMEDGKLTPVVVETGATDGRQVEIVRGIEAGKTVYLGPSRRQGGNATRPQPASPFMPSRPPVRR